MIFEGLSDKLQNAFGKLRSKGKLTEADVKTAMRKLRWLFWRQMLTLRL